MIVTFLVMSLAPSTAAACPSCPTSRIVAAVVCSEDFWRNVAAVLAPFPLFAWLGLSLHRLGRPARTPRREAS